MHRYLVALAALFIFSLISPISVSSAQIVPVDVELPTGDVWPSLGERICIPQEGLAPSIVNDGAKSPPSPETATPNSKNQPSKFLPNNAVCLPHIDTPSGRNCAWAADAAEVCDSLPHKHHRTRPAADARYRNPHPRTDGSAHHRCSCTRVRGWH
jgi:hypothetical protein